MFEKRNCPCKQEIRGVKIKRQVLDHYLPSIIEIISPYGIFSIIFFNHKQKTNNHTVTTDKVLGFSKDLTTSMKNFYYENPQRANSIIPNDVFSTSYSYVSNLEKKHF